MPTHTVLVQPGGVTVAVGDGQTLMAAARAAGYRWPNVCGGEAMCGVCFVRVLDGDQHVPPMEDREQVRLRFVGKGGDAAARLACQLRVSGAVTVFKRGVRPESPPPKETP